MRAVGRSEIAVLQLVATQRPNSTHARRLESADKPMDLFAGIPVTSYAVAVEWYERLFGAPPSFLPTEIEAVWELAEQWRDPMLRSPRPRGDPGRAGDRIGRRRVRVDRGSRHDSE